LPHQLHSYETLSAIARVTFGVDRSQFPLQIRPNVCLVGPSGVGKTHLAGAIGQQMDDVKTYYVNVSTWLVMGSSHKAALTWPRIQQFLESCRNSQGAIIIVDEIDKIGDPTSWTTYLRSEVFDLLDWRIPRNLEDTDGAAIAESSIAAAEEVLRTKTMIIGVGAFQRIWDSESKESIGFLPGVSKPRIPDANDLSGTLPRELSNRFGSNIIAIPPLARADYDKILESILARMPTYWRERYATVVRDRIDDAVRQALGTRFFEEALMQTLVRERQEIASFRPETLPSKGSESHPNVCGDVEQGIG
ncbi:MAG: ATP-binding protein, partial [Verrucomicrobiae bacterium]|nr:ATP-binding protein [Verrucomicrobiae bacterium]